MNINEVLMNYIYNFFILTSIISLSFTQVESVDKNKPLDKDSDIIKWDEETKKIKNPELQKLLNELKEEFIREKEILHNVFKDKVKILKKDYSSRRKALIKEYRKKNKNKSKENQVIKENNPLTLDKTIKANDNVKNGKDNGSSNDKKKIK